MSAVLHSCDLIFEAFLYIFKMRLRGPLNCIYTRGKVELQKVSILKVQQLGHPKQHQLKSFQHLANYILPFDECFC